MTLGDFLISAACLAFGSLVQSILGFGMGIVSIPMLVWGGFTLPQAIVMVLPNVFLQTSLNCWQNRGHMPWKEVGWFFLLRMVSMPVGVLLLRYLSTSGQESTRQLLGFSVITMLILQQTQRWRTSRPSGPGEMVAAGTASGFFAGLIGMGGPPLIIWALRQKEWGQLRQRSFLWFTFLLIVPWQILMMLLSFDGLLSTALILGLAASPFVILVAWCGAHYGNALSNDRVRMLMQIFLLLIAAQLILGRWFSRDTIVTDPEPEVTATLRIGTRSSALALWQAHWVADRLRELGAPVELIQISTEGDRRSGPIGQLGAQGVFTKEIQRALLANEVDLAVHSLKDLPTDPVAGLRLAAVPLRENPGDVLVSSIAKTLEELPESSRIGTGSVRRRAQLLAVRSDLNVLPVRGNVDTRLRKLNDGEFEGLILAEAGLTRLGLMGPSANTIPRDVMLPAVGQGALGLEIRAEDEATAAVVRRLDHSASHQAVLAERSLLSALRGGCLAPVGAWGRCQEEQLTLDAVVLSPDGKQRLAVQRSASLDQAEQLGRDAADELLRQGAAQLIQAARDS